MSTYTLSELLNPTGGIFTGDYVAAVNVGNVSGAAPGNITIAGTNTAGSFTNRHTADTVTITPIGSSPDGEFGTLDSDGTDVYGPVIDVDLSLNGEDKGIVGYVVQGADSLGDFLLQGISSYTDTGGGTYAGSLNPNSWLLVSETVSLNKGVTPAFVFPDTFTPLTNPAAVPAPDMTGTLLFALAGALVVRAFRRR